jgi:biotin carboxylase
MKQSRSVLVTDNLYDYALAVSAHRRLAEAKGLDGCYPVMLSSDQVKEIEPLLSYYGITPINFASLFQSEDFIQRSREIERSIYPATSVPIVISSFAPPAVLARSLSFSLRENNPLVFVDLSYFELERIDKGPAAGRPDHLIIAHSQSPLAVAAAFYAAEADKRLCLVDNLNDVERMLQGQNLSSVMLVDDFATFNKGFLERLLQWSMESCAAPLPLGILTAYSPNEFSALVWRLLIHRDFHRSGHRSAEPEGLERLTLQSMKPVEYYVISEHGNEMHMHHGHHEVICGAFSSAFKRAGTPVFNCEINCPHEGRVRSSEVLAHNVIILSCNTFTLGDGIVPPEYAVILNFLNGWPTSIIAPFKHVQSNLGMAILVDALIRSGYSLGEISQRLNSVTQLGTRPDYAYVLIGDPEVVPSASDQPVYAPISVEAYDSGVEVECSPSGKRVVECLIPQESIAHLMGNGHALTVDPVSRELCEQDVFFAFRPLEQARQLGVMVFSTRSLPDSVQTYRLHPAHKLNDAHKRRALDQVRKISELSVFGIDKSTLQTAKDIILEPVRAMLSYPRPLELALGEAAARHFQILLNDALWRARHLLIERIMTDLGMRRLWFSQQYGQAYPLQYRLPTTEEACACPTCNSKTYAWRYEDNCTDLPSRNMLICARCGIIADGPAQAEIEIQLPPFNELVGDRHEQKLVLRNLSDRKIDLTIFAQFNQWRKLGSTVAPLMQDIVLEPGETVETEARFTFEGPLPNDILEIQSCVLTDRLDLYCVTQRGISSQGGIYLDMAKQHRNGNPHEQAEHHAHHVHATQDPHHSPQSHGSHASAHSHESHHAVLQETAAATNGSKDFLVFVEPHAALFRYLEIAQQNYRTLILTSNPDSCRAGEHKYNHSMARAQSSHIDQIVECDTGHSETMLEALQPFGERIAGVLAGEDSFVPVSAELGTALGFDYTEASDAICLHLKTAMKQRFAEKGVPTPRFVVTHDLDETVAAWEKFHRNCMVKMVDSASSMNIYRVTNRADLEEAWDTIVHNRKNVVTPIPLSQEVIVEEFVGGRELSIEGYIQDDKITILNFCEKVTGPNFIVVGHYLPAEVSPREEEHLRRTAEKCVRALELRNSVFHVEVHIMNDIPYVIECAGRPPGQHMVELMRRCYGFDMMQISIDLATGKKVSEPERQPQRHYAMLALYSEKAGILQRIEGLEELQTHGGASHVHLEVKEGDRVPALSNFSDKCGFVILEDESAKGIRQKTSSMRENFRLVVSD